jgi:hypothetical protein
MLDRQEFDEDAPAPRQMTETLSTDGLVQEHRRLVQLGHIPAAGLASAHELTPMSRGAALTEERLQRTNVFLSYEMPHDPELVDAARGWSLWQVDRAEIPAAPLPSRVEWVQALATLQRGYRPEVPTAPTPSQVDGTHAARTEKIAIEGSNVPPQPRQFDEPQAPGGLEKTTLERLVKSLISSANQYVVMYENHANRWSMWSRRCRITVYVLIVPLCVVIFLALLAVLSDSAFAALCNFLVALGVPAFIVGFRSDSWWKPYRLAASKLRPLIPTLAREMQLELPKGGGTILAADLANRIFARLNDFVADVDKIKAEIEEEEMKTWTDCKDRLLEILQWSGKHA